MFSFKKMARFSLLLFIITLFSVQNGTAQTTQSDVTVIELTQNPGVFNTIDLNLKPGKYQFRVVNNGVDHELGFVIQKAEDANGDLMKTAIPESFTTKTVKSGEAQYTGVVELKKGEYVYSCPLNPTPHYKITVK